MSFPELSKEKKQYLALGGIVTVILVVLSVFGIKISLSSISEAKLELQNLVEKIEKAEKSVALSQREKQEFCSTVEELTQHLSNIPPDRNYYSWATETIYAEAREINLDIDAIDEINAVSAPDHPSESDKVELESYSLRITAHGGYDCIKQFLKRIAENHPLVRVTGIEISSGRELEIHDVQLFIEWPFNLGYVAKGWKDISMVQTEADEKLLETAAQADSAGSPEISSKPTPPPPRNEQTSISAPLVPHTVPEKTESDDGGAHEISR